VAGYAELAARTGVAAVALIGAHGLPKGISHIVLFNAQDENNEIARQE
jgi:hypothetical protein